MKGGSFFISLASVWVVILVGKRQCKVNKSLHIVHLPLSFIHYRYLLSNQLMWFLEVLRGISLVSKVTTPTFSLPGMLLRICQRIKLQTEYQITIHFLHCSQTQVETKLDIIREKHLLLKGGRIYDSKIFLFGMRIISG